MFDAGTNEAYEVFIEEFVEAVQALFPKCCIQWGFASTKCSSDPGALPKLHCQQAATASPVNVGLTHQTMRSTNMGVSPAKIFQSLLTNPADPELVKSLTTPDVTYVSLNENNPDLKAILPWAGTNKGPETICWAIQSYYRDMGNQGL